MSRESAAAWDQSRASRPGEVLLHPIALLALVLLVLNDQALKATWPGAVTGKLSDLAGLVLAPLILVAAWEVGEWLLGRWDGPSPTVLAVAVVVVGIGFAAVQVWGPATDAYRWMLGLAQWPFRAVTAILAGTPLPDVAPVVATADVEDLLAVPALAISWWLGRRRLPPER